MRRAIAALRAPTFAATFALSAACAVPALGQETTKPAPAPSRLQAEVAAEMVAPAPYGVPSAPYGSSIPRGDSQSFGNANPSYQVGRLPVGVDAAVAPPYSNSWADNVGGQPASSGHSEVLAYGAGIR